MKLKELIPKIAWHDFPIADYDLEPTDPNLNLVAVEVDHAEKKVWLKVEEVKKINPWECHNGLHKFNVPGRAEPTPYCWCNELKFEDVKKQIRFVEDPAQSKSEIKFMQDGKCLGKITNIGTEDPPKKFQWRDLKTLMGLK